jgi:hypothetical protein
MKVPRFAESGFMRKNLFLRMAARILLLILFLANRRGLISP